MSVAEDESANATNVETVPSGGQKRLRDSDDDDEGQDWEHGERKEERKAANRRSAFQSRLRKKLLIEELQKKVDKLSEELSILKENNRTLTQGLEASLSENRKLRFLHQQGGRMGIPGLSMGVKPSFLGSLQGGNMGGLMGFRGF
jgi:predicted RNase H-like nuclease (RuvC/YqgF family)